jgi:hypothetical protein
MPLHTSPEFRALFDAALLAAIVLGVAALTAPLLAWLDAHKDGMTAQHSRLTSSIQGVVTTIAFTLAYAVYPGRLPAFAVASGIAVLLGLALGGEIQAERLDRRARAVTG